MFEDAADDLEADEAKGKDWVADLVNLRFPNGQVVFRMGICCKNDSGSLST